MINVEDINFLEYQYYYFIGDVTDISLKLLRSDGYHIINDYDIINTPQGNIVGFKKVPHGHLNYVYDDNGKEKYINLVPFNLFNTILNKIPYDYIKFFIFHDSIQIPAYEDALKEQFIVPYDENGNPYPRCDYNYYGGMLFYMPDNHYPIKRTFNIINRAGIGHIAYIETTATENLNPNSRAANVVSGTYAGILRLIYEWYIVSQEPFSNDENVAKKARLMWDSLELPEDLKEWIANDYSDMRLARFIRGENGFIDNLNLDDIIPQSLIDYTTSNCLYSDLYEFKLNHSNGSIISNSLLEKEYNDLKNFIEYMCLINNIQYSSASELLELLNNPMHNFTFVKEYDIPKILESLDRYEKNYYSR